jgi:C_GCAxxG_C_C family probable redox protein
METADIAVARYQQGYSCSQSVFSALAEPRGVDPGLAYRIALGLGGGIARSGHTCGCLTGALMAIGLERRCDDPEANKVEKERAYELGGRLLRLFAERNGATDCRDLLGCDLGTEEGRKHARELHLTADRCPKLVRDAVEIATELLDPRARGGSGDI